MSFVNVSPARRLESEYKRIHGTGIVHNVRKTGIFFTQTFFLFFCYKITFRVFTEGGSVCTDNDRGMGSR